MKVGYIQTSPSFGEKTNNFEQIENIIANEKADLLVLPELFATGYTFISKKEVESLAEDLGGVTARFLVKIAQLTGSIVIGGFIEKDGEKLYNAAMIVSKKGVIDTYRKIHLYFKEKLWFSPGDKPLKVHKVDGVNVGIMICFDWIFPESVRSLALLGADIITHPANLVLPYCQTAMITRCLENRVFVITANRIGTEIRGEDNFTFTGGSQITSARGEALSHAPEKEIYSDFVDIDINLAHNKALNNYNDIFNDRIPNLYKF